MPRSRSARRWCLAVPTFLYLYLKLENLHPIGFFKMRGAANVTARTPRERLEQGLLTASAGNMAQGVAYCPRRLGVPATVVAPDTALATKIRAAERLGARGILVPLARWSRTFGLFRR